MIPVASERCFALQLRSRLFKLHLRLDDFATQRVFVLHVECIGPELCFFRGHYLRTVWPVSSCSTCSFCHYSGHQAALLPSTHQNTTLSGSCVQLCLTWCLVGCWVVVTKINRPLHHCTLQLRKHFTSADTSCPKNIIPTNQPNIIQYVSTFKVPLIVGS